MKATIKSRLPGTLVTNGGSLLEDIIGFFFYLEGSEIQRGYMPIVVGGVDGNEFHALSTSLWASARYWKDLFFFFFTRRNVNEDIDA